MMKKTLSYADIINNKILNELAGTFSGTNSRILLASVGYTRSIPNTSDPLEFWDNICHEIEIGAIEGGFERLLEAASQRFPSNSVFKTFAPQSDVTQLPDRNNNTVSIVISGWNDPVNLLEVARRL